MSPPVDWAQLCLHIGTVPLALMPVRLVAGADGIALYFWGPDVVLGLPPSWHSTNVYPYPPCGSLEDQLRYALLLMEVQAGHEVREAFTWLGARVFDPHRPWVSAGGGATGGTS